MLFKTETRLAMADKRGLENRDWNAIPALSLAAAPKPPPLSKPGDAIDTDYNGTNGNDPAVAPLTGVSIYGTANRQP